MHSTSAFVALSYTRDCARMASATLIALCILGWAAWFYPFDDALDRSGTPLGADFAMFYTAGGMARDGQFSQLYDQAEHQRRLHALFPGLADDFCLPYRYPPLVALAMAPLAMLPYATAYALFVATSLAVLAAGIAALACRCRLFEGDLSSTLWLGVYGCPVVLETLIGGQASLLTAGTACLVIAAMMAQRPALAGALLALALAKPNVLLIFTAGALIARPALLRGWLPAAGLMLGLTLWTAGSEPVVQYVRLASGLATSPWSVETPAAKVHSLAHSLPDAIPHLRLLCTAAGLLVAAGVACWWRSDRRPPGVATAQACGLLLLVNALLNPYTPIYDLALLPIAFVCLAEARARTFFPTGIAGSARISGRAAWHLNAILLMLYFGPHLSQALAAALGFQLFPFVIAACLLYSGWMPDADPLRAPRVPVLSRNP